MARKDDVIARLIAIGKERPYLRYPIIAVIAVMLAGYHLGRFMYSLRKKAALATAICGVVVVCYHSTLSANAVGEGPRYINRNMNTSGSGPKYIIYVDAEENQPETTAYELETVEIPRETEAATEEETTTALEIADTIKYEQNSDPIPPAETETVTEEVSAEDPSYETEPEKGLDEEIIEASTEPASENNGEEMPLQPESSDDWKLMLVNRDNPLPEGYEIATRRIQNGLSVDERIYEPLMDMLRAGNQDGCSLIVCSAYRSYDRQTEIYVSDVAKYQGRGLTYEEACQKTEETLSIPGASEHQAGIAADIVAVTHQVLNESFADTREGKWLAGHAHEYGFILRYPREKEDITGISYEPWHFRYVGIEAATEIYERKICLEEYLELINETLLQ